MGEEKKNESKFHFVSAEEISSTDSSVEEINEIDENINESLMKDDNLDATIESAKNPDESVENDNVERSTEDKPSKQHFGKPYLSFEARVVLLLLGVLILIGFSCYFFYKTITYHDIRHVSFDESSNVHYKVCLNSSTSGESSCLGEGVQYTSNRVKNVQGSFEYISKMSADIDYDVAYNVVAVTRIFDAKSSSKDLYKTEDVLVSRKVLKNKGHEIKIDTDFDVDIAKFNEIVEDYKLRYSKNVSASVDIILYYEQSKEIRDVASITIPLNQESFSIGKYKISNIDQSYEIQTYTWNRYTIFNCSVATILLILSMVVLYKLTHLVWKVTNNRNNFQARLSQILREYDRIIVVARDGYTSNVPKTVIKVNSFNELLKAREALEKPIIYSKVNSVKSEFIVEDDEKLYKYVLKEVDI